MLCDIVRTEIANRTNRSSQSRFTPRAAFRVVITCVVAIVSLTVKHIAERLFSVGKEDGESDDNGDDDNDNNHTGNNRTTGGR